MPPDSDSPPSALDLLAGCPASFFHLDGDLRVVASNTCARERFGPGASPGEDFLALLDGAETREAFRERVRAAPETGFELQVEVPSATGPGTVPVLLTGWRVPEGAGESVCLLAREVQDLVRGAGRLVRAEKLAGVGRVAAQLAHQLNTPLASILLSAQAVREDVGDPELVADMDLIVEETRRCRRIVKRLQNFARTGGTLDDRVNLCHLVHRVLQILGHSLDAAGVEARLRVQRGRYLVRGDPSELEHALFALLENALDESPRGAVIRVALRISYPEGSLEVRVRDDGRGIEPGMEERIFEPFFTTKEEGRGTGLGLCIARRILEEHGGGLRAGAPPGGGAEFVATLPLSRSLREALAGDPEAVEVRAVPFEVLQARARGEFAAGCEVVGVPGAGGGRNDER